MACLGLGHCINKSIPKVSHHLSPEPGVIGEYVTTMDLFTQPAQFVRDPVLYVRSLDIGEKTQYSFIWLCHDVDSVIETPVNLPLRQEQLCSVVLSIECLRRISCQFGSSPDLTWSRSSGTSWWSTTSTATSTSTSTPTPTA